METKSWVDVIASSRAVHDCCGLRTECGAHREASSGCAGRRVALREKPALVKVETGESLRSLFAGSRVAHLVCSHAVNGGMRTRRRLGTAIGPSNVMLSLKYFYHSPISVCLQDVAKFLLNFCWSPKLETGHSANDIGVQFAGLEGFAWEEMRIWRSTKAPEHPGVIQYLVEGRSLRRHDHQHAGENVFAFGTQPCGIIDDSALDLCMKRGHMLIVKRNLAADEYIKNDSKAPDVDLWTGIGFGIEKFGGGKIQRTAKRGEIGGGVIEIGEAEINDLDVARLGDENVFYFQVSVDDVVLVTIL